ncbi:MAG TPA: hypothetical protein VMZ27_07840, partial [Candidatus Saccharimonadales bacterium]|nr:hypothetical protein [Candidatus Saccharimonadales bacterium]
LSPSVTGTQPITYQWLLNGTNLPGATSLFLQITNAQTQNAGEYQLIVDNDLGSVFSDKATIIVRYPVALLQQPVTTDVRVPPDPAAAPTTNVTFTVNAYSIAPISYQWKRNGTNIPGATSNSFTVFAVKTNDLSYFSVVASDDASTIESTNAWLYPLVAVVFTETPISQSVVAGSQVTLSAAASGWPPPYTYEWRLGAAILRTTTTDDPSSFFTFTAPTTPGVSTVYRVVVKNRAFTTGRLASTTIITLADSDGDGIPDEWETRYGYNPNSAADRAADFDGDGMLNWQEYQAGTDPTNALSNLKLTSLSWSNSLLQMQFQAVSNRTYALQYNTSLESTNWLNVSKIVGRRTNHTEVLGDPASGGTRFYRVVTPAAP